MQLALTRFARDLLVRHERLTSHASKGLTAEDIVRTEDTHMEAMMSSFPSHPPIPSINHDSEIRDNNTRNTHGYEVQNIHAPDNHSETLINVPSNAPSDAQEHRLDSSHDLVSAHANKLPTNYADDQVPPYETGGTISQPISTLLTGGGTFDDLNTYWDDFDVNSAFILPVFDDEYSMPCWPPKANTHQHTEVPVGMHLVSSGQDAVQQSGENLISLTRFGSPMPSPHISPAYSTPHHSDGSDLRPPAFGRISSQEYAALQAKVRAFQDVLPATFALCSRRMLSRFYEGYVNGYNRNIPLVHLSTLSIAGTALSLLLAMAGVGAYYRFEAGRGDDLLQAARAVSLEYIRRRQGLTMYSKPWRSSSTAVSPPTAEVATELAQNAIRDHRQINTDGATFQATSPADDSDELLQTTNALFLVMSMWIWRPRTLMSEALSLQSLVANLVREIGSASALEPPLTLAETPITHRWKAWIRAESNKRTRLVIFAAFNLHCIAYNIPPLLLSSEVRCTMPSFDDEWRASSPEEWAEVSRRHPTCQKNFQERLDQLYQHDHFSTEAVSSLGAYVLIAALVQRVFFLRQSTGSKQLKIDDIDELGKALRGWQTAWENGPESSLNPQSPFGSVAFNSTALLRLAWIRLHCDLGPCRSLESRDPVLVAKTLKSSPPLDRRPRLTRAVLQAAHALLIPMRMGLQYAARVHTPSWSMLHALCNLECAFLLTKWLESVALTIAHYPLEPDEADLLRIVRSIMDETDFPESLGVDVAVETVSSNTDIRRLGVQIANVWADIFKTAHAFDLVTLIGDSLEKYAQLLEQSIGDA